MKRFKKIYIEIGNICNLSCSFCPKTTREPRQMNIAEFKTVIEKIFTFTDYVYFHLMGEPLLHPALADFLKICEDFGLKVIITTNGTLVNNKKESLINSKSHYKTVISLHSFEVNDNVNFDKYIDDCLDYVKDAKDKKIVALRLWNNGGKDTLNNRIFEKIEKIFSSPWSDARGGKKLCENVYLQFGDKFNWPDIENPDESDTAFCYGLRDQIGILADGTVVPCCLDNNGNISLGNIFETDLESIINSKRATAIYNGFSNRQAVESLCKKCTFARKF